MKILAIDSSGVVASVAVLDETRVIGEYTIDYKLTHSATLMPMIEQMNQLIELDLATIDAIAVAKGPGSFTGLRIGAATAKGLGLALKKKIVGVPTLEALAYNVYYREGLICPIMDARRHQVYTGIFKLEAEKLTCLEEESALDIQALIDRLKAYELPVMFTGDGVAVYEATIQASGLKEYLLAPNHMRKQRASAVGALALEYLKENREVTATEFAPYYLRKSQAEREYENKMGQ